MNKAQRSKVWRIFWRNKWEESKGLLFTLFFSAIFLVIIYFIDHYHVGFQAIVSAGLILLGTLIVVMLRAIQVWLQDNWKKAKRQAGVR